MVDEITDVGVGESLLDLNRNITYWIHRLTLVEILCLKNINFVHSILSASSKKKLYIFHLKVKNKFHEIVLTIQLKVQTKVLNLNLLKDRIFTIAKSKILYFKQVYCLQICNDPYISA